MSFFISQSGDEVARKTIIVGSRKSKLALIQTELVINELKQKFSDIEFVIKTLDTVGDNILDKPLSKIGEKALFTRELEEELLLGNVDIIVHSLKDLPTTLPEKCCIGAITKREDPSDSLVFRKDLSHLNNKQCKIEDILKDGTLQTFGTSSLRRTAQLKSLNKLVLVKDVRGNLNTRLAKLDNFESHGFDCLILATSGLKRAGFDERISCRLEWFHAVSQGALGIECRINDQFVINEILQPLVDQKATLECTAERVFMKCLEGGCSVPIGVRSSWSGSNLLTLEGVVLSLDGTQRIEAKMTQDLNEKSNSELNLGLSDFTDVVISNRQQNLVDKNQLKNTVILGRKLAEYMIGKRVKEILNAIEKTK